MSKTQSKFNFKLFQARKEKGWTQEELAKQSGVSKGTIASVENGQTVPTVATAIRICKPLGELVEQVFAGVNET